MKIELVMKGETKIFTTPFVSARQYRKLLEYDQKIDFMDMSLEEVDELVGFVREVFGDQFTIDEFYDGIPSHEMMDTLIDVFGYVRSGEDEKVRKKKTEVDEGNDQGK